ncbi:MAG: hypothetical protein ACRBDL_08250 [Alphaproteobacteria bacterium]
MANYNFVAGDDPQQVVDCMTANTEEACAPFAERNKDRFASNQLTDDLNKRGSEVIEPGQTTKKELSPSAVIGNIMAEIEQKGETAVTPENLNTLDVKIGILAKFGMDSGYSVNKAKDFLEEVKAEPDKFGVMVNEAGEFSTPETTTEEPATIVALAH